MEHFDSLFFDVFQYYKPKHKAKANDIALFYILLLQAAMLLLVGTFLMLFLNQMRVDVLSFPKALTLFVITIIALIFRNWIYYTGKKRKVLNAHWNKKATQTKHIWLLWLIPFVCLILSIIILQRI